jgi:DNA-binding transcriptional regulator YdaS (Cro superfamily)
LPAKKRLQKLDKVMTKIRAERGLSIKVAKACGIARAAVYQWSQVPVERVHDVAKVLDMTPEQIRPDIFRRRKA